MSRHAECAVAAAALAVCAGVAAGCAEQARAAGVYTVEFADAAGVVQWRETVPNLVTTAGKNFALDTLMAGSSYTAAWYLLLIDATGYTGVAAADTASSHAGWAENTGYSNSTRPAVGWNAASGGSKASTTVTFNINAGGTIKGCGLASASAKGATTNTLYSAGLFIGGDQPVTAGGTLNVTYTASL